TPNVPFVQSNLTLVFDPGAGIPSIPLRSINNGTSPLVLFVVYPSGTGSGNHSYRLAKWNGTSWVNGGVEICTGGDTTPQYIGDAGHAYNSGEFCLNHNDFNEIFASRLISGGTFEISRWRTDDGGLTWTKKQDITSGSSKKQIRPVFVKNAIAGYLSVLWFG